MQKNGIVRSFNKEKGYGFITSEDGRDVFLHFSQIQKEGLKDLDEGENVTFELSENERGAHALNVVRITDLDNKSEIKTHVKYSKFTNDSPDTIDCLNIYKEINVLKKLISQDEVTPLSVGILGEWGSGKSFYMNVMFDSVQNDIELKDKFIQIKFNAWHYSESNILVSLSNQIFTSIKSYINPQKMGESEVFTEIKNKLESKRKELIDRQHELSLEIASIDTQNSVQQKKIIKEIYTSFKNHNMTDSNRKFFNLIDNVNDIKEFLSKPLLSKLFRYKLGLPLIILFVVLCGVNYLIFKMNIFSGLATWWSSVFTIGVAIYSTGFTWTKYFNFESLGTQLANLIDMKTDKVANTSIKKKELNEILESLSNINCEYDNVKNGRYLDYLLNEKIQNERYLEELSTVDALRNDIQLINNYFEFNQDDMERKKVILYIDDLDRCPADKVMQVLETVHLLLTYKMFIVFVAMDTKWISKCYAAKNYNLFSLSQISDETVMCEAYDYLEKIFQLTIRQSLLYENITKDYVRKLCFIGSDNSKVSDTDTKSKSLNTVFNNSIDELTSLKSVIELDEMIVEKISNTLSKIYTTPRRIKRFVNTYQLVNANYDLSDIENEFILLLSLAIFYPH